MINHPLFTGNVIRFTAYDLEKDPQVETAYTHELQYARKLRPHRPGPMSAAEIRKHYEKTLKKWTESAVDFFFAVRPLEGEDYLGFVHLSVNAWTYNMGWLDLVLGQAHNHEAVLDDCLKLVTHYAYRELNLFGINTHVPAYHRCLIEALERSGFVLEVRQRQADYHAGQPADGLMYGLLATEWQDRQISGGRQ